MKRNSILMILMLLSGTMMTRAQGYQTAVGIRFSSNAAAVSNSITFKHFFNAGTAFEGLFSFGDHLAVGALLEKHRPLQNTTGLQWLYGAGAYVGFSGTRNVGAQGILGLDYKFPTLPINLTLDWKPELNFVEELSFEPAAVGLSARFSF